MNNKPSLHPTVIESHAKIKAWNEYVIDYLGLKLEKRNEAGRRSMSLRHGSLSLYHDATVQIHSTTNAEMHKSLQIFLESYLQYIFRFKGIGLTPNFKPPII